jgi:lipopolysaccharide assembly outer membrane protein LptD (OstA)
MIRPLPWLLALFLVSGALAQDSGPATETPWTITGERLEGTRAGVTTLISPRAVQGSTVVTATEGLWFRDDDLLHLTDNVVLRDSVRTVTSDRASFDRGQGLVILTGRVRGNGPEGRFEARELWYWRETGKLELRDSVRLEDDQRTMRARRLVYDTRLRRAVATDSVVIVDAVEAAKVTGRRCEIDRFTDETIVTGDPRLHREGRGEEPDLDLRADTLQMGKGHRFGEALGNVRIHRGSVTATCGRALFDFDRDLLRLRDDPRAVDADGDVTGDSMAVVTGAGRAERLEVLGRAQVIYQPAAKPGERNIVVGDTLVALMDSSGVYAIDVKGHARSLYIPSPEDRKGNVGQNLSRGERIRVWFDAGEAKRVDLERNASGEYLLPRAKADTTVAQLSDSLYLSRAGDRFLASPDAALPDSLVRSGPFDPAERVGYQGDSVSFFVPKRTIVIRGNGKVRYQNLALDSKEIVYDAAHDRVTALGEPTLKDPSSELVGRRMVYRLDSRQGFVYQGRTQFDGGYYDGEEIKRVDSKILLVKGGDYTTCDADTSHFHFHSSQMKIRLGDRVVARPIYLYMKNIPVFALPYWIFPIRKGRHSGVLMPDIEFGFSQTRGRYLRNIGYYLAPNDYMDTMIWGDYYEQSPRWILNSQLRYRLRYVLSGDVFGSYSRETGLTTKRTRWDLRGNHDQQLGDRSSFKVRMDFVSDASYRDDQAFGGSVDERLNRILRSNVDLRKTWSTSSISLTADRTENLDKESSSYRVQQNIPSIDYTLNSFAIGAKPDDRGHGGRLPSLSTVYTRFNASYRSTFTQPWGKSMVDNQAARVATGLTDSRSLGNYLKLAPSVSATGVWFRRDARARNNALASAWDAGISGRSTLYGTFPLNAGPFVGLRHVVEPSASYRFAPELKNLKYRNDSGNLVPIFPSVGGISIGGAKASAVSFSLTQRFHLKLKGEDPRKPRRVDNLILWQTSTGYDFLRSKRPLTSIANSMRFKPARFVENSVNLTHDPYSRRMIALSIQTTFHASGGGGGAAGDSTGDARRNEYGSFGQAGKSHRRPGESTTSYAGPWTLSMSHSYSRGTDPATAQNALNMTTSLTPTRNWHMGYSIYYDMRRREIRSQSITLDRDLHCWEFHFDKRISGGNSEYAFRINVKALPDVKWERQSR